MKIIVKQINKATNEITRQELSYGNITDISADNIGTFIYFEKLISAIYVNSEKELTVYDYKGSLQPVAIYKDIENIHFSF